MSILLALLLAAPQEDLDDLLKRMEERTDGIHRFSWNVRTYSGMRNLSIDKGIDVHGLYRKGIGLRSKVTYLGCADANQKSYPGVANHKALIYTPDTVSFVMSVVDLELPEKDTLLPYGVYRARRGDPSHSAIDPVLLPRYPLSEFLYLDSFLLKLNVAPGVLLRHEPGLRIKAVKNGHIELESFRDARNLERKPAPEWYDAPTVRKTIRFRRNDLRATEYSLLVEGRYEVHAKVLKWQTLSGVSVPRVVKIEERRLDGTHSPYSFKLKISSVLLGDR